MTQTKTTSSSGMSWKMFGPGILMASAAIGASHLISSTKAGALFGWQLAIMILLANLFKYPFFRFGTDYVYSTGDSLIAGYAKKSKIYLWIYFILSIFSAVISVGAVALLAGVILVVTLGDLGLTPVSATVAVCIASWLFLIVGKYSVLDKVTKIIMVILTLMTVVAVFIAASKPSVMVTGFVEPSPWNFATLGFIVALMGWMPAPLEFSAISSMWITKKIKEDNTSYKQGLLDFNVGFIASVILALFFLALGVFVQYGSGVEIAQKGGAYVGQVIHMYTATIGEWSKLFVGFIAFMCMFGTTIAAADGYGRANAECWRLIKGDNEVNTRQIFVWTTFAIGVGLILVTQFQGQLGNMLKFAMTSAFVSAPIFAWLNYSLVKDQQKLSPAINILSIAGMLFLIGFAGLFLLNLFGFFAKL